MELVPAALETRCLILLPAAPGLAPAVLDYYLRNAAFLAPFEPSGPRAFIRRSITRGSLPPMRSARRKARACAFILR